MFHVVIKDEDIGYENVNLNNPKKRIAARGIVLKENKIAIFNKQNKNEFKLPGGGVEKNENVEETFKREVLEETGCIVEIIKKLGTTEEIKGKSNFHQISHVYLAKVIKDTGKLQMTEKEIIEGGRLLWTSLDEAIELIKNCYNKLKPSTYDKTEDVYSTKFIIKRDLAILQNFKSLKNYLE